MKTVESLADLRQARATLSGRLGLVRTRSALHRGHLSLVERARAECDHVAVCILELAPHPGPSEGRYPGALDSDLQLLEPLGVDLVWAPESLNPPGHQTWVTVERVSAPLEGKHRPGHFRDVATAMAKLFNAFTPQRAYFGQKNAQQVAVVRCMVQDLSFPVEVVACRTLREPDGLALSRHNSSLSPAERQAATVLNRALTAAQRAFEGGERDADALRAILSSIVASEPLAREEYVSVADATSLAELERVEDGALLSMAVRIGKARLTDNCSLP